MASISILIVLLANICLSESLSGLNLSLRKVCCSCTNGYEAGFEAEACCRCPWDWRQVVKNFALMVGAIVAAVCLTMCVLHCCRRSKVNTGGGYHQNTCSPTCQPGNSAVVEITPENPSKYHYEALGALPKNVRASFPPNHPGFAQPLFHESPGVAQREP